MYSRIFKYILALGVIIVVVAAGLLFSAPYLVSTDSIRIRLAQDLSAWTGYNVQLREPPHLSFFPSFEASLTGVTLSRPQDGAPLMEAQRIDVDLSLLQALFGHVEFSETRIIAPHFIIEEPLKTTADFLAALSHSQGTFGVTLRNAIDLVHENPENPDIARTLAQPFGRIIVQDGRITYRLNENQPIENITKVNAILDWQVSNRNAALNASGVWHGQMTNLQLSASRPLLLLAGAMSETRLSINSQSGGVTLSGQAKIGQKFIFDGHVSARSPGWSQTADWLNWTQSIAGKLDVPVVLESAFNVLPERIMMNDVALQLGEDNARGALEVGLDNSRPLTSGSLAFQSLNLDIFKELAFPQTDGNAALDLSLLDRLAIDIRLSAPEAKINSITLTNLAASIQIRQGRGVFDLGSAGAFSGMLQSNIQISHEQDHAFMDARISGSQISLNQLAVQLHLTPYLDGSGNFTFLMKAPFEHWHDLATNMTGELTLTTKKTRLSGYEFGKVFAPVDKAQELDLAYNPQQGFDFDRLNFKADIKDGVAITNNSSFHLGQNQVTFSGLIPFAPSQDPTIKHRDAALNLLFAPTNRSDETCADVECLINSLVEPSKFFLWQDEAKVLHVLSNEKDKQSDNQNPENAEIHD